MDLNVISPQGPNSEPSAASLLPWCRQAPGAGAQQLRLGNQHKAHQPEEQQLFHCTVHASVTFSLVFCGIDYTRFSLIRESTGIGFLQLGQTDTEVSACLKVTEATMVMARLGSK